MSLLDDERETEKPYPCPDCEKSYASSAGLARHRENAHGVARPRSGGGGGRRTNLQADLAKAHLGVSMLIVGATNPSVLGNVGAVDVLEKQSNQWAASLHAVAQQDERVMRYVSAAMHAGVWVAFVSASATSLVTLGALSGKLQVPYGAVAYLAPDLVKLFPPQPVPQPPNGKPPTPAGSDSAETIA